LEPALSALQRNGPDLWKQFSRTSHPRGRHCGKTSCVIEHAGREDDGGVCSGPGREIGGKSNDKFLTAGKVRPPATTFRTAHATNEHSRISLILGRRLHLPWADSWMMCWPRSNSPPTRRQFLTVQCCLHLGGRYGKRFRNSEDHSDESSTGRRGFSVAAARTQLNMSFAIDFIQQGFGSLNNARSTGFTPWSVKLFPESINEHFCFV